MNPEALRYYERWLRRRSNDRTFLLALGVLLIVLSLALMIYCRFELGDWAFSKKIAFASVFIIGIVAALIWLVKKVLIMASWSLLEGFEDGFRSGHFREVWFALMTKYRGIVPTVIWSKRFHLLFAGVGSAIISHEDLTPEQEARMIYLVALAKSNLNEGSHISAQESTSKYLKPIIAGMWISILFPAVVMLIKLLRTHN